MKSNNTSKTFYSFSVLLVALLLTVSGCKKFLEIPLPLSRTAGEGAYSTDKSSAATINNILAILAGNRYFDGASANTIAWTTGLYTDELENINPNNGTNVAFYSNSITAGNTGSVWSGLYKQIYNANLAIEGVSASTTLLNKNQWLGEAYFLRAFCYFHLVNYYGDVVLTTSSDYILNKDLPRVAQALVYKQIIADLVMAQSLLTPEYKDGAGVTTTNRGRPNKFTASALLAKAYLYTGDWINAEAQATSVITATIGATSAYALLPAADIDKVFLAASAETIFNLVSLTANQDYIAYNNNMAATIPYNALSWTGIAASISQSLLNAFVPNTATAVDDRRKTFWLRRATMSASTTIPVVPSQAKYFPNKYKSNVIGTENIILFRLAEQYLIRAEARARQNNLDGAKSDLDLIRTRAGLTGTTAVSQTDVINAVLAERRLELFTELGHRFFDLKRTETIDAVMNVAAPAKGNGATWNPLKKYFPIATNDILANPNLIQTPGY